MNCARSCEKCQRFPNLSKASPSEITAIVSPWPFALWGVDLIGLFPPGKSQLKWVIVAVDYFTKWIEAEAMATITSERVKTFYWKRLICRFGTPMTIISDNGQQFVSKYTTEYCQSIGKIGRASC